jgi:hypothetical protein
VEALSADEPAGILNPGRIDDVAVEGDVVTVHLRQTCEWDGSDHLVLLLQEKLFNYLSYVADGELARAFPGHRSRWQVVVDCTSEPDRRSLELLRAAAGQFESLGGSLVIRQPPAERR